jgi:hypothetical protein
LYDLLHGTVQGSISGPLLYAIYVSPLFVIEFLLGFADNNYIPRFSGNVNSLIADMEKFLESITKWLKNLGLAVNTEKTDICLFYKHDMTPVKIRVNEIAIKFKNMINVLGVLFHCKVNLVKSSGHVFHESQQSFEYDQVSRKIYFNTMKLLQILMSNYIIIIIILMLALLRRASFWTTFYGLYIYKLHFFHDLDHLWAASMYCIYTCLFDLWVLIRVLAVLLLFLCGLEFE